jgi:DNA polymerase
VPRPVDIVIDFLKEQQSRGLEHVTLDDEAREFLNLLVKQRHAPAKKTEEIPTTPTPEKIAEPQRVVPTLQHASGSKSEQLEHLKKQLADWPQRHGLDSMREKLVFSFGNPDASIMLVGESPGLQDENSGVPFSGPAGEKFDAILKAMGLLRSDVYLTYLVKFRPSMPRQTTNNRTPSPAEIAAFLPALAQEVSIIKPKLIMTLGTIPSVALCGGTTLEKLRVQWHQWNEIPVRASESPSLLLTASNPKKREVWEDMLAVMEHLAMPINDKQRGYFEK